MLVVDQHALHERVLFEQLQERMRTGRLESQRLLVPEPIELTPDLAARTLDQKDALAELGLAVDDFGGGTLLLTAYPALLSRTPPAEILRSVVDFLASQDRLPSRDILLTELLSRMACHAAVRSGDALTQDEIAALDPNASPGRRHPSLPAWPTNRTSVHSPRSRQAVPANLMEPSMPESLECWPHQWYGCWRASVYCQLPKVEDCIDVSWEPSDKRSLFEYLADPSHEILALGARFPASYVTATSENTASAPTEFGFGVAASLATSKSIRLRFLTGSLSTFGAVGARCETKFRRLA